MSVLNNIRYHKISKQQNKRSIREILKVKDELIEQLKDFSYQTDIKLNNIAS